MTFKSWIGKQRNRKDSVGDVARDAWDDKKGWSSPETLASVLRSGDACAGAWDAFRQAVAEFTRFHGLVEPTSQCVVFLADGRYHTTCSLQSLWFFTRTLEDADVGDVTLVSDEGVVVVLDPSEVSMLRTHQRIAEDKS